MKLSHITVTTCSGTLTRAAVIAGVAGALALLGTGPAAAAGAPDPHAPCLAAVFQVQAVEAPQTVSDRILDIRDSELNGDRFGQVLKPLAQLPCSEL